MRRYSLTAKLFFLIVLNDLVDTAAHLLMKKGLMGIGFRDIGLGNVLDFISRGSASPLVWLGIVVYILNFFIWIVILNRADLSVAMPVGSTSYIFIPIAAVIFLGEAISPLRWAGIIFIVLGIHFVSRSRQSKEAS